MLRKAFRAMIRRVGRRGAALAMLGAVWLLLGYGFATTDQDRFSRDGAGGPLQFLDDITTPWLGMVWAAGGLTALACAAVRNRLPRDDYGFVGLAVPTAAWAVLYLLSWIANMLDTGTGRPISWLASLVFTGMTIFVLFIARWPDPDDPHLNPGAKQWDIQ